MRLLLDECVPRRLAREFTGHVAEHALDRGWSGLGNGALLDAAEAAGFGALITVDQGIESQQNLTGRTIAVVVLVARSNDIAVLRPLVRVVLQRLIDVRAGEVMRVT